MEKSRGQFYLKNDNVLPAESLEGSYINQGKAIYEVIRIIKGVPLFWEAHLARLAQSARLASLEIWLGNEEIEAMINRLLQVNRFITGNIKVVLHYPADKFQGDIYIYYVEHKYPQKEDYRIGVDTILYRALRHNPEAKVADIKLRTRVDQAIKKAGVYEAILVDGQGRITEGSRSNIFMVREERVFTAPKGSVLPGITRGTVIELINKLGYQLVEEYLTGSDLARLKGLFITGTSPGVLPVRKVGSLELDSVHNRIIANIMREYDRLVEEYVASRREKVPI